MFVDSSSLLQSYPMVDLNLGAKEEYPKIAAALQAPEAC
jgi:hypothetical protein